MKLPPPVVFDCMIYAQALISPHGPAAQCVERMRRGELHLVWSDYVLREIRELPPKIPPRFGLTPDRVDAFILDIAPHVEYLNLVAEIYVNPFDPDDSHYVNLAVAAHATLITSRDGDLLRLMELERPEAREFHRRFPAIQIVTPTELLALLAGQPGA